MRFVFSSHHEILPLCVSVSHFHANTHTLQWTSGFFCLLSLFFRCVFMFADAAVTLNELLFCYASG